MSDMAMGNWGSKCTMSETETSISYSWSSSDSWGSSISWGSNMCMGNSMGCDMSLDSGVYNGLLYGDSLFVDDWSFDNLVDWTDLVGLWDWDGTWNSNFVGFGDVLDVFNNSFYWDWDCYWYIIWYLVYLKFWLDTVETRGNFGVGTDWSIYYNGGYGISWGWSVDGCWDREGCWGSWYW
jgi:hypothetical protein